MNSGVTPLSQPTSPQGNIFPNQLVDSGSKWHSSVDWSTQEGHSLPEPTGILGNIFPSIFLSRPVGSEIEVMPERLPIYS
jgi:hypothetical protein